MLYELRKKLQPALFAAILLTSCLARTGVAATEPAQVPAAENAAAAHPGEIDVRQAGEKLKNGAFFLDVRGSGEWDAVRIPGAVLIPLDQLQNRLDEIPRDRDIVIVCASGSRSRRALDVVRKAGFERSSSMWGGIRLWIQAGYPVEEGK